MTQFRSPLTRQARITSTYEHHMSDSRRNFAGIDLVYADGDSFGQPIVATSKQKILSVQDNYTDPSQPKRFGEKYIYTQDYDNPDYTFLYLHNDQNLVVSGDIVDAGFTIATMGFSGWTIPDDSPKGTHLHYEVRVKGKRENPEWTTDFNDWGQTIITPQPADHIMIAAKPGYGISHLARDAGITDFGKEYVWQAISRANGVYDGLMKVFVGKAYKVPKHIEKPVQLTDPTPTHVEPPVVVTPELNHGPEQPAKSSVEAEVEKLDEIKPVVDEKKPVNHPTSSTTVQKLDDKNIPESTQQKNSLPIWLRSVYDTAREGSYAIAGMLVATGGWEMIQQYILTGDFSQTATQRVLLGVGAGIAGYIQAIMKEERKKLEKK